MTKYWIWQKIEDSDFKEIQVEVTGYLERGIRILHDSKEIELRWDGDYGLRNLKAGKTILIYIFEGDYTKAYVMPHVRNPAIEDIESEDIYKSILDKMNQSFQKKKQKMIKLLEINTSIMRDKPIEQIIAIKDKISGDLREKGKLEEIERLIRHQKLNNDQ